MDDPVDQYEALAEKASVPEGQEWTYEQYEAMGKLRAVSATVGPALARALREQGKAYEHWNDCDDCHQCERQGGHWCPVGDKLLHDASALGWEALAALADALREVGA